MRFAEKIIDTTTKNAAKSIAIKKIRRWYIAV